MIIYYIRHCYLINRGKTDEPPVMGVEEQPKSNGKERLFSNACIAPIR